MGGKDGEDCPEMVGFEVGTIKFKQLNRTLISNRKKR
jgi:hypothetical protein